VRQTISIPLKSSEFQALPFAYLQRGGVGGLSYLQSVRTMSSALQQRQDFKDLRAVYINQLDIFCAKLAANVEGPFDSIVSPPSRRPELVAPYRARCAQKFGISRDLSECLKRKPGASSGEGTTIDDLAAAMSAESIESVADLRAGGCYPHPTIYWSFGGVCGHDRMSLMAPAFGCVLAI
jgi:hypothetical protein